MGAEGVADVGEGRARGAVVADPLAEALVAPALERAAAELAGISPDGMLTEGCQEGLLRGLERLLLLMSRDTLDALVARRLAEASPIWGADIRLAPRAEVARARDEVAEALRSSRGAAVDAEAPLLRAELARASARFVRATTETCERIWADRRAIATTLLAGGDAWPLLGMDPTFGPTHDGGRRTCVVTCAAGRFVYKPHDCRIDRWLAEVAERHLPGALGQPATIVRSDDGGAWAFQEYVRRTPVSDEAGIGRYWRNMGRAMALFQVLGSGDLHHDNFVAAGEVPSLIDAELVLSGRAAPPGSPLDFPDLERACAGLGRDVADSVVHRTMLPGRADGHDISPLLEHGARCLPVWEGREHDVLGHEDELLAGLDEGMAELSRRADELAADVRAAERLPVRKVLRDTTLYARMLMRLWRRDAYDPSVRETLLRRLAGRAARGERGSLARLASSEAACLAAGDVPYFSVEAGSRAVVGSDGTSDDGLLETSAVERALARLGRQDGAHRSFAHAVVELNLRHARVPDKTPTPACVPPPRPLCAREAVAEAESILARMEGLLVASPSGASSWLFRGGAEHPLTRSPVFLARGLGGVAAFLAALAPRAHDRRAGARALTHLDGCLARLSEAVGVLEAARVIPEGAVPLGLADGLGGIVRSLDLVARALGGGGTVGSGPLGEARALLGRLLAALDRADVAHARRAGVYTGCAGLLLALAQCRDARADASARKAARRLAQRLLSLRSLRTAEGALWDGLGRGWPVSGLGHGQAGVAAALVAAGALCPDLDADAGRAAAAALAWELSRHRAQLGSWPDLRDAPVTDRVVHGMCVGAPGVGLCALSVRASAHDDALRGLAEELLARADASCASVPPGPSDTLDSGIPAVADYLLSRGDVPAAGRLLGAMVVRARKLGHYVLQEQGLRQTDEPDLLFGLAGVGYELLRYADPALPGVLVG